MTYIEIHEINVEIHEFRYFYFGEYLLFNEVPFFWGVVTFFMKPVIGSKSYICSTCNFFFVSK